MLFISSKLAVNFIISIIVISTMAKSFIIGEN